VPGTHIFLIMKYSFLYIISIFFIACRNDIPLEITEVEYNKATIISNLDVSQYHTIYQVDSTLIGLIGNRDKIEIFNLETGYKNTWGESGYGPGEFIKIGSITSSENKIFIYDSVKKSIEIFDKNLTYLDTVYLEMNLLSMQAESDTTFFASTINMDQYSIIQFSGSNFAHKDYLLVESTRNPSDGAALINLNNGILLISRLMTNRFSIIKRDNKVVNVTNNSLPKHPQFDFVGGNRVPTKTVWQWGFLSDEYAYQLVRENDFSNLYRYTLEGNLDKIYRIEFPASRMFEYQSSYLFVSTPNVYKISKTLFK